ncbi:glycosyltransferase [Candidatus Peregrinibacteria bacterium]|jgi:GT2 family glycosyltransferase|nr:glycosyltransferase [Candidatus Peregrinibacteria bacterium]MBT7009791.1 glycosyltransferase [Candidatus Peregrinibacteria bacterium]
MSRKRNKSKKEKFLLDVVVPTAGRYDILEKCLDALETQTVKTFNIYLIDGNEDIPDRNNHRELLEKYNAKMLGQNVGYPRLCNTGIAMGKAPLVLLLTDDVLLSETAVDRMLETMKDDSIGMLGIKLLFPDDSVDPNRPAGKVQHIGLSMDVEANVIHPLVGWSANNPKCCVSRDVFGVTGACFVIRRELFNRAGGFDEDYGLGTYEDVSLSLSVKAQGKRVYLDTDIIGHHHVGATAQKKNLGFPLRQNANIFRAKWSNSGLFLYDSYKYY